MNKQKFKTGDRLVFGRCKANSELIDITVGKIYTVFECDNAALFADDSGDWSHACGTHCIGKTTKIID